MEDILRSIYQERASQKNTLGIIQVEKDHKKNALTDTFHIVLLIIVKEQQNSVQIKHYHYNNSKAALHVVSEKQLNEWLLLGSNRKIVEWLYEGRILFDRNEYLESLRKELRDFPFYGRKIKTGLEFAKLIRRYMDGRSFFQMGHYLDAYNHIIHSLHHLARLSIIENGYHPELTVWSQVKQIEPEIYKLYEELVKSEESIEKRLELLFLASEFMIYSRTSVGASHLIDILKTKEKWSFDEIATHEEIIHYGVDLSILIEYLIEKDFIQTVDVETKGIGIYHRYYKIKE
ncbi:MAG TPA: nucleotidyltransferase-like protein [Bacillaceae bacterium]|nr:nucleotidyltransferase-like protein [Bacillaceae bacterium]